MIVTDKRANNYLQSLLKISRLFRDDIQSVILFGSHARNMQTPLSDVDVLLVLKQRDKRIISQLTALLRELEFKFEYAKKPNNILENFLNYLNIATGMFRSWFICSIDVLVYNDFAKITGTNKLIGKIFVPSKLILYNIKNEGRVIYGESDFLNKIPGVLKDEPQPIRSFILNEIISVCALVIAPFTNMSLNYSLEAIKWSLFILKYENLINKKKNRRLLIGLTLYKKIKLTGNFNPFLSIFSPFLVFKIHAIAFHELKKIKTVKK